MSTITAPLFCVTSDIDWASDYAISDFVNNLSELGIKPTIFATHKSGVIDSLISSEQIEIGVHPNFFPGSSHGNTEQEVIDYVCSMYPQAKTYRSHSFFSNFRISQKMFKRDFRYDSNLCLYMQPNVVPLRDATGTARFPVFWEDDVHWLNSDEDGMWDIDKHLPFFLSPGLKIINVHPFNFAANIPNQQYYEKVKSNISTLNDQSISFEGKGTKTFINQLLKIIAERGHKFYTLGELYQLTPISNFLMSTNDEQGRHTQHTEEEYKKYWTLDNSQKQEFIKQSYDQRNPTDPYATSRDYNARELEIKSIKASLKDKGAILDLGCGNGYTLLSLAKELEDWSMVGIDFAKNLIQGAIQLMESSQQELRSEPSFTCADALAYLRDAENSSVDYVITERFIQNLPSSESQEAALHDIYRVLRPRGRLLMCEAAEDGFNALNTLRESVGLSTIPATSADNISAIRIKDSNMEEFLVNKVGFSLVQKLGYSAYFVMTRVLHPLLVSPQRPRFDAKINDLAAKIQDNMPFQPGYGSNTLWVLEKS